MEYPRQVVVVCTGLGKSLDKKPCVIFQELNPHDETTGPDLVFLKKRVGSFYVGGVYQMEQVAENSFAVGRKRWLREYEGADVAGWQVAAKAFELEEAVRRREAKHRANPAALALLEPLRREYVKALPDARRAIEVIVLDYLRRGF